MAASYPSGQGGVAVRRRRTQAGRGRGCEAASYPSGQGGVAVRGGDGGLVGEGGGAGAIRVHVWIWLTPESVSRNKKG